MPLRVIRANVEDLPLLDDLYFKTFKSSLVLELLPNIPTVREWHLKSSESEMAKPYTHYYKVVDDEASDEIIAYAKWSLPHAEESQDSPMDLPADGNPELFKEVVRVATEKGKALFGDNQVWYIGTFATLPQHQRRGAASLLMTEFCKQMDEDGKHKGYVESSPLGASLYRRFGFEEKDSFTTLVKGEPYVDLCMVREPTKASADLSE